MQAAILAAGEGTRISSVYGQLPKSLIPVAGIPLIDLQLRVLDLAGFEKVAIITRKQHYEVVEHIKKSKMLLETEVVMCDTIGGMYSLFELQKLLDGASSFFLLTVDNVFDPQQFANFATSFSYAESADIVTWVTPKKRQSELPVGVLLDDKQRIVDFGKHLDSTEIIAEGPFYCQQSIFEPKMKEQALRLGITGLSDYFRFLLYNEYVMQAYQVDFVIDVDTLGDLTIAEKFVSDWWS